MVKVVPTTETSLYDLLGVNSALAIEIHLQSAKANGADLNFGPKSNVDHYLEPGKSVIVPVNNLKTYYIKSGNGTDSVIISLYIR